MVKKNRKRSNRSRKSSAKKNSIGRILKIALPVVLGILISIILFFNTRYWDGKSKMGIVFPSEYGVHIAVLDPAAGIITKINIPANTQVEVARNLGIWKIDSIWQLGKDEGLGGRLLKETTTNRLKMPVIVWSGETGAGIIESNPKEIYKGLIHTRDSNLNISDRIRIALFSLGVKKTQRETIELEESLYLRGQTLPDGEEGYVITTRYPEKLFSLFTDSQLEKAPFTVSIINSSNSSQLGKDLGEVVEVVGAKVVSIRDKDPSDHDCIVGSESIEKAQIIAKYFNCSVEERKTGLDIEIEVGNEFLRRF